MKRAIIAVAILLAGCGGDPEPVKPSPSPSSSPSPVKHLVTGNLAPDWNGEMADQPWAGNVISVDWNEGLIMGLRIVVTDSAPEDDILRICRTGLKFYADHTDEVGLIMVHDSLGQVAQGASGTCRPTQG